MFYTTLFYPCNFSVNWELFPNKEFKKTDNTWKAISPVPGTN